jgi:2-hydroxychromene-2-carboxylate isomerase
MSLRSWLMPAISQRWLSRDRLLRQRVKAEARRVAQGKRHALHYFHQVDDPYSALTASVLPQLLARYDLDVVPHLVGPPPDAAAPERDKLIAYSRQDAQRLGQHHGLVFSDTGRQPDNSALERVTACLLGAIQTQQFTTLAGPLSNALWTNEPNRLEVALKGVTVEPAQPAEVAEHLKTSSALRQQLGHYLGATFYYGGEWYWGVDRLHHLERRLQALGVARPGVVDLMFAPDEDEREPMAARDATAIDFFFSLRSPYSAIVAQRVFTLGQLTGAPVRLRYVLPMVMRGLAVPRNKRQYIALDTAREAFERNIPFGRLNDPVGAPTERGLALIGFAERSGKGQAYVLSFMHGVWAEGLDAGSDRGLKKIVERANLSWDEAKKALKDEDWRRVAEDNRAEMFSLGLWGVPSFRVNDTAVWGQDRLWAVQDALLNPGVPTDNLKNQFSKSKP